MLVGIDSITDEGVLESLWKPHKSKERNFLHRCYTQKKSQLFFKIFFGDRENIFVKIFSRNIFKKISDSQNRKILKFQKFHDIFRFWEFHDFVEIFENFRKSSKIFRKKNLNRKKIISSELKIFLDDYYMNF